MQSSICQFLKHVSFFAWPVHWRGSPLPKYIEATNSNTACLEGHAGFFRLLIKGVFDHNILRPFDKKMISNQ